jgi:tetratricopeptide (TPR) repeat protein
MATARFRLAALTLRDDPEARTAQVARAEREAAAALALDSASLQVREVYDNIRTARARAIEGRERAGGRLAAGRADDSISIGVAALETMWLATATTLGQQTQETLRDSMLEGPEAAAELTFEARVMMSRGGFSEAAELLDSIVATYPQTQEAWDQLLRAEVALGHLDRAIDVVARWDATGAPGAPGASSLQRLRSAVGTDGVRGYWTWRRDYMIGQQGAGRDIVLTDLAAAYAALGERDRAYALLDQALEAGESRLYALPSDPVWDPLRGEARFRRVEQEIQRRRIELAATIAAPDNGASGN